MDVLDNIDVAEHRKKRRRQTIEDAVLVVALIVAVIIGIGLGIGLRDVWSPFDKRKIFYLKFPGQLLLNMLKCLILPLIMSSLITATAALDKKSSSRLGLGAITYYMSTTFIACVLGIILVLSIHPGDPDDKAKIPRKGKSSNTNPMDALLDLISEKPGSGTNVLGMVVFSLALGCVINHLQERGKPLLLFFESLNDVIMVLVKLVIWYSPIGILFLIASKFVETDDIKDIAEKLGMYMVTVITGLSIHGFIILPVLFFIFTRKNPARFALNMAKALLTSWGTSSSSATLPITMECLTQKNKVDERVVRFVAPIGATINMDGTALYEAVASIFIAQVNGVHLSLANVIVVSLTATAAAIGAAGIPQAGLVTMVIVLTAVDLPTEDVTLILAIDWFLDRFRTVVNVWGDSVGAGILNHLFRDLFVQHVIQDKTDVTMDLFVQHVVQDKTDVTMDVVPVFSSNQPKQMETGVTMDVVPVYSSNEPKQMETGVTMDVVPVFSSNEPKKMETGGNDPSSSTVDTSQTNDWTLSISEHGDV